MTADRLTVLTSVNRRLASKTFSQKKDGTIQNRSYGNEKYFSVTAIEVAGIGELARALEGLSRNPHAFVVRGEPLPGIDRKRTRRLLHPDRKTGEPATFTEAPRRWVLVDVDEIACPAAIDPKSDPEDAVEHVIGLLPAELHDAWCWWQLSSSQSVFSDTTISMHLWVWLDAPLGGDELKRWAIAANQSAGYKLIDPALFSAVQAHYVAAPDFVAPLPDPLPRRCGLRQGLDDIVSLIIPPPHPKRRDEPGTEGYDPGRGVKAYLDMIGGPMGFVSRSRRRSPPTSRSTAAVPIAGRSRRRSARRSTAPSPTGAMIRKVRATSTTSTSTRSSTRSVHSRETSPAGASFPSRHRSSTTRRPPSPMTGTRPIPTPQTKTSARCRRSSATRRWRYNSPLTITPTGATPHCGASGCSGSAPIGAAKTHCGPSNWRGGSAAAIAPRPL
jgi:hypothetical protein